MAKTAKGVVIVVLAGIACWMVVYYVCPVFFFD